MRYRRKRSRGLSMAEVLILIGILVCIGIMLLPAILASRENTRRLNCMNNMAGLGLAYHGYGMAHKRPLASSGVTRDANGKVQAVDGWSWLVLVLPYMDDWYRRPDIAMVPGKQNQKNRPNAVDARPLVALAGARVGLAKELYDTLDVEHGRPLIEPVGAKGTPHADALATALPGLLCPSFGGSPYTDFGGKEAAITNYKPLGATHIESLSVASPNPLTPKYNPGPWPDLDISRSGPPHPDGSCFPGGTLEYRYFRNGLSNTLLLVESLEPRYARWTVGSDAAVVALPRCIEFEDWVYRNEEFGVSKSYGVVKGYGKALKGDPAADDTYWFYHTYLDWDYSNSPCDAANGASGERYGPSSNHPNIVNHLLMDGSSCSLNRDIDITLYMALIKRRWE